jgi:hypothetical protein
MNPGAICLPPPAGLSIGLAAQVTIFILENDEVFGEPHALPGKEKTKRR